MIPVDKARHAGIGLLAAGLGLAIALHHPLWPVGALAGMAVWALWVCCFPGTWLTVLLAALPIANFSPWTGWLVADEFDLLVLATLSGLHASRFLAFQPTTSPAPGDDTGPRLGAALAMGWWVLCGIGLLAGMAGAVAAGAAFNGIDWYASHGDALWAWRASKSLAWALLLWPWVREAAQRGPESLAARVGAGMVAGLAAVCLAVLWERLAYPGFADFTSHYRSTAPFWEMHVGGAAIDAYLAMATPFAIWALRASRGWRRWALAGTMVVLASYASLTTFSRGVYLAVGASTAVMLAAVGWRHARRNLAARWLSWSTSGLLGAAVLFLAHELFGAAGLAAGVLACSAAWWWSKQRGSGTGWRRHGTWALTVILTLEVFAVLGADSFMKSRIDDSPADLDNRMAHWRHGLGLLKTPQDWLIGKGAGRFPALYAASAPDREFPGRLSWGTEQAASGAARNHARLEGPRKMGHLGGLFSATQRVPLDPGGLHSVKLLVRARQATPLLIKVCEKHLLYDRNCQVTVIQAPASGGEWVVRQSLLRGKRLDAGSWFAPRMGVFSVAVLDTGGAVDIAQAELFGPDGVNKLRNSDFSAQLASWFPSVQRHYLPWHIDNLALELLIERGLAGLLMFAALAAAAIRGLVKALAAPATGQARETDLAATLLASLCGMLCVGLVSSVLDVPRISFLAFFLMLVSLALSSRWLKARQA